LIFVVCSKIGLQELVFAAGRAICKLIALTKSERLGRRPHQNVGRILLHAHLSKWITHTRSYILGQAGERLGQASPFYFVTRTHAGFIKRRTSRCFSPALSKQRLLIPQGCWRWRNRREKRSASTFVIQKRPALRPKIERAEAAAVD